MHLNIEVEEFSVYCDEKINGEINYKSKQATFKTNNGRLSRNKHILLGIVYRKYV